VLRISGELLHGVLRATSADDTTLSGIGNSPEWPPSPARLYAALVAGAGTGHRCPPSVATFGLNLLESPPLIFAASGDDVLVSGLVDRYVVVDSREEGTVQDYVARKSQKISVGCRVAPRTNQVVYIWPQVNPSDQELSALRYRAARVPYVGCADSPALVTVDELETMPSLPVWRPDETGRTVLPIAQPGYVTVLDEHFRRWSNGEPMRRSWMPTTMASYLEPGGQQPDTAIAPKCVWFRFDRPLVASRLTAVTRTLRASILEKCELITGSRETIPEVLHGHLSTPGQDHQSARWLALPTVAVPHADGRLRGACLWLPPDTPDLTLDLARSAAALVTELIKPGHFGVSLRLFDGTTRPWTTNPRFWTTPSKRWVTATAILPDRFNKNGPGLDDVSSWCRNAGLPEPISCRVSVAPLTAGAFSVRVEKSEQRLRGRQFHVALEFATAISGPVVIGRGRGFGLGLMLPAGDSPDA